MKKFLGNFCFYIQRVFSNRQENKFYIRTDKTSDFIVKHRGVASASTFEMLVGPGIIRDSDLWSQTVGKLEEMRGITSNYWMVFSSKKTQMLIREHNGDTALYSGEEMSLVFASIVKYV
jgi:hypothetical protein